MMYYIMVATQVIGFNGETLEMDVHYIGEIKRDIEKKKGVPLDDIVVFQEGHESHLDNGVEVSPNTTYYYQVYPKVQRVEDELKQQRIRQARYKEALRRGYMSWDNFQIEYRKNNAVFFVKPELKELIPPFVVVEAYARGSGPESGLDHLVVECVYRVVDSNYLEQHIEIEPENMWATPPRYQVKSTLPEKKPTIPKVLDVLGEKDVLEVEKSIGFSDRYRLDGKEIVKH